MWWRMEGWAQSEQWEQKWSCCLSASPPGLCHAGPSSQGFISSRGGILSSRERQQQCGYSLWEANAVLCSLVFGRVNWFLVWLVGLLLALGFFFVKFNVPSLPEGSEMEECCVGTATGTCCCQRCVLQRCQSSVGWQRGSAGTRPHSGGCNTALLGERVLRRPPNNQRA